MMVKLINFIFLECSGPDSLDFYIGVSLLVQEQNCSSMFTYAKG